MYTAMVMKLNTYLTYEVIKSTCYPVIMLFNNHKYKQNVCG